MQKQEEPTYDWPNSTFISNDGAYSVTLRTKEITPGDSRDVIIKLQRHQSIAEHEFNILRRVYYCVEAYHLTKIKFEDLPAHVKSWWNKEPVDYLYAISMEEIKGVRLDKSDIITKGTPTSKRILMASIVYDLWRIHQGSVLHLDLTAQNIIIDDATGMPRIIDFGLSQTKEESKEFEPIRLNSRFHTYDHLLNNFGYGAAYNERDDVWSIGILLLYLTGLSPTKNPIATDNILDTIKRMIDATDHAVWNTDKSKLSTTSIQHFYVSPSDKNHSEDIIVSLMLCAYLMRYFLGLRVPYFSDVLMGVYHQQIGPGPRSRIFNRVTFMGAMLRRKKDLADYYNQLIDGVDRLWGQDGLDFLAVCFSGLASTELLVTQSSFISDAITYPVYAFVQKHEINL